MKLTKEFFTGMNEGGNGYDATDYEDTAATAAWEKDEATRFAAEWTADVTAARRATWNAWVKAHNGPVATTAMTQFQREAGWTLADLKRAVALHG